jgi:hypothetical protein
MQVAQDRPPFGGVGRSLLCFHQQYNKPSNKVAHFIPCARLTVIENGFMKPKIYRLHHAVFVILLASLLACASCKSNSNPAAQPASNAKPSPPPPKRLVKKAGWEIPGLLGAKEARAPRVLPAASNAKVYTTWLSPQPKGKVPGKSTKVAELPTLRSYLAEEQLQQLGITAKKLYILTIIKYDLGDRPFCYIVKYRSTYGIEALHYYDEDGDKLFELVETGVPLPDFVPRIPGWAQQQQQQQ